MRSLHSGRQSPQCGQGQALRRAWVLNLGGSCSAGVGGDCVAKSSPCGQVSASGCTTLSLRAQRKLSTCGLHCASRSHYTLSPQFIRLKGRGETKEGLDSSKFTSGSCYAVMVMAVPMTLGASPLPPITAPRGEEPASHSAFLWASTLLSLFQAPALEHTLCSYPPTISGRA